MSHTESRLNTSMPHWINDLGLLISSIGGPDFYKCLASLLQKTANYDSIVAVSYDREHPPQILFEDLAGLDREALYRAYFDGAYLLSPFYLRWLENNLSAELFRLQDIVPDGFFNSIYYTDYYLGSGLHDEAAYLIPIDSKSSILLSLGRSENMARFTESELTSLAELKTTITSCVIKHASLSMKSGRAQLKRQLSQQLLNFGSNLLTDQEQRVAQLLLRGHSSKSCARKLEIATTTERVHRRNIYAKLEISSQAELFARFFDSLASERRSNGNRHARQLFEKVSANTQSSTVSVSALQ